MTTLNLQETLKLRLSHNASTTLATVVSSTTTHAWAERLTQTDRQTDRQTQSADHWM